MASASTQQRDLAQPCFLFTLPPELREEVYKLVLPVEVLPWAHRGSSRTGAFTSLSLLRVNRQIHTEATPILFKFNTINLHIVGETLNLGRGREVVQLKTDCSSLVLSHQTSLNLVQPQHIKLVRRWRIAFSLEKVIDSFEDWALKERFKTELQQERVLRGYQRFLELRGRCVESIEFFFPTWSHLTRDLIKKVVYISPQSVASPNTRIAGASREMREVWTQACEDKAQLIRDLTCDAGFQGEELSLVKCRSYEAASSEDFAPWGGPYVNCFGESERLWHELDCTTFEPAKFS